MSKRTYLKPYGEPFTMDVLRAWVSVNPETKCWEWQGNKDKDGYGKFKAEGRYQRAHRAAYELTFGEIPHGMCVLHRCDNTACCNPDHLWVGTNADNMRDRDAKGRGFFRKGMRGIGRKLSDAAVAEIRFLLAAGVTQKEIADQFGICQPGVSFIKRGKTYLV